MNVVIFDYDDWSRGKQVQIKNQQEKIMDSQHYQEDADGESVSFPVPVRPQRYFSLKWNNFENQLLLSFSDLYMSKEFTDISLICEGKTVRAHKIILSMCSPYFRQILKVKYYKMLYKNFNFDH